MAQITTERLDVSAPDFVAEAGNIIQTYELLQAFGHLDDEGTPLRAPRFGGFFGTVHSALHRHFIMSVARLSDPAYTHQWNVGLKFFSEAFQLDDATRARLTLLRDKMESFAVSIKPARNKLIGHNDADVLSSDVSVGGYNPGDDTAYVAYLKEFADIVSHQFCNEGFDYAQSSYTDLSEVARALGYGLRCIGDREPRIDLPD